MPSSARIWISPYNRIVIQRLLIIKLSSNSFLSTFVTFAGLLSHFHNWGFSNFFIHARHVLSQSNYLWVGHGADLSRQGGGVGVLLTQQVTKWEHHMITQKKWAYINHKRFTGNIKKVVPKRQLFQISSHVHSWISHRGHKYEKVAARNYAEISQMVVNTLKMCLFHT